MAEPAEMAETPGPPLRARPGRDDVQGLAVIGLPFASRDILCLRRFPRSSFGPGYTSIWHRAPTGDWTVFTSVAPEVSCPRFIGSAISRAIETPIELDWTGPRALRVWIPAVALHWEMQLARTPITWMMNLMMAAMPAALFRSNLMLWMMSAMSTALLAAGRFRLGGHVPNRQWFQAAPRRLWMVPEARASIGGRDFGPVGPLAEQAALGELLVPQRGVLMFGGISFEAYSPERHLPAVH
jgi:hypothetical protein